MMTSSAATLPATGAETPQPTSTDATGQESTATTAADSAATKPAEPEKKPQENVSKTFSAVARREKALQRQREELQQQRTAFEKERSALQAQIDEIKSRYAKPESPLKALERYGYSYKDATDFALNNGQPTPEQIAKATRSELEEFKRQQQELRQQQEKASQEQAERAANQTIAEFKEEIGVYTKDKDDYELINVYEGQGLVYDTVEEHFNKTGKVLSIKEASDLVEKYLTELGERTLSTKKFKARTQPQVKDEAKPTADAASRSLQPKTLSNEFTNSTPTLGVSPRLEDERIKRALAALG